MATQVHSFLSQPLPINLENVFSTTPRFGLQDIAPSSLVFPALTNIGQMARTGVTRQKPKKIETALGETLPDRLFDARSRAKLTVTALGMHLSERMLRSIYSQFDDILSTEEWDVDDAPLQSASIRSFLRFIIFARIGKPPSIGLSAPGNILAAWRIDARRITIEFLSNDRCRVTTTQLTGTDTSITSFFGDAFQTRHFLNEHQFNLA